MTVCAMHIFKDGTSADPEIGAAVCWMLLQSLVRVLWVKEFTGRRSVPHPVKVSVVVVNCMQEGGLASVDDTVLPTDVLELGRNERV